MHILMKKGETEAALFFGKAIKQIIKQTANS